MYFINSRKLSSISSLLSVYLPTFACVKTPSVWIIIFWANTRSIPFFTHRHIAWTTFFMCLAFACPCFPHYFWDHNHPQVGSSLKWGKYYYLPHRGLGRIKWVSRCVTFRTVSDIHEMRYDYSPVILDLQVIIFMHKMLLLLWLPFTMSCTQPLPASGVGPKGSYL